jgi:peptidoglycan hydrolase-like protein with peptidoglycan-binding domain
MLQAQLQRAGYDIGEIDGDIGPKTEKALVCAGFGKKERDHTKMFGLPTATSVIWTP